MVALIQCALQVCHVLQASSEGVRASSAWMKCRKWQSTHVDICQCAKSAQRRLRSALFAKCQLRRYFGSSLQAVGELRDNFDEHRLHCSVCLLRDWQKQRICTSSLRG
mmetsp:Transcript_120387/g.239591  ORF Transcript_120387/g.239591 Transcript_120387/m.239591 type:complete len:108 (+) Transcript_120387:380-703(+)